MCLIFINYDIDHDHLQAIVFPSLLGGGYGVRGLQRYVYVNKTWEVWD
jgi:hypothetical protein